MPKEHVIQIRIAAEDFAAIKALADVDRLPIAAWCRSLIAEGLRTRMHDAHRTLGSDHPTTVLSGHAWTGALGVLSEEANTSRARKKSVTAAKRGAKKAKRS